MIKKKYLKFEDATSGIIIYINLVNLVSTKKKIKQIKYNFQRKYKN